MAVKIDTDIDDTTLAKRTRTAENACQEWKGRLLTTRTTRGPALAVKDLIFGDTPEVEETKRKLEENCAIAEAYRDELERRKREGLTYEAAEAEIAVAAEEEPGETYTTGGPVAVWEYVSGQAEGGPLGFFERMRESAFGVFGLAKDQPTQERVVGLIRLALAAIAIYFVYKAAAGLLVGGVGVAERSAERFKGGLMELADKPAMGLEV